MNEPFEADPDSAGLSVPDSSVAGRERMLTDAARRRIEIELVPRPDAHSLEEAASLLGVTPAEIIKSLVVKRRDGGFLFALVPGDRQLSWPKLRAVVGVSKLQLPSAEIALAATGYERGWSAFVHAESLIAGLAATVADISD